jgi:hypothetical protein
VPCVKIINSDKNTTLQNTFPVGWCKKAVAVTEAMQFLKLKHVTVNTLGLKLFYTVNKNTVRTAENAPYHHYKIYFENT